MKYNLSIQTLRLGWYLLLTIVLFLISHTVSLKAQDVERVFPIEAYGTLRAFDMEDTGEGYAFTSCGILMYTTDFGQNWSESMIDVNPGAFILHILPGTGGDVLALMDSNNIYLSEDNGQNWTQITAPGGFLANDFEALDDSTLVVADRAGARIQVTYDRGENWNFFNLGHVPFQISFPTDSIGYATSIFGDTYKTTDKAASWNLTYEDPDEGERFFDMEFVDENTGYRDGNQDHFLRTTDGGITWDTVYIGFEAGGDKIYFTDSIFVSFQTKFRYRSTDGGQSWINDGFYVDDRETGYLQPYLVGDAQVFLIGYNKAILYSDDQAQTFSDRNFVFDGDLADIVFADDKNGVAGIDNGSLLSTTDNGESWIESEAPGVNDIDAIEFASDGALLIAGANSVWRSADRVNFDVVLSSVGGVIDIQKNPDGSVLYAVASDLVSVSTDNGQTWSDILTKPIGFDGFFSTLDAPAEDIVYVSGTDGFFIKSEDGGQTWNPFIQITTERINSMDFINANTGFFLSRDSVRVTKDGGQTFAGLARRPFNGIEIDMADEMNGFIVGSNSVNNGSIYRTEDGGLTWSLSYESCQGLSNQYYNGSTGDFWFCGGGGNIEVIRGTVSSTEDPLIYAAEALKVYPNPAKDQITVELPKDVSFEQAQVKMYNLVGQELGSYPLSNHSENSIKLNKNFCVICEICEKKWRLLYILHFNFSIF